ncbi:neuroglian-like [Cotesia glomerata]|uniref:Ig-like domain-containing protein n=1 Tax=Cotesia glomerata TaxID=32391 RepID=A0AAV7J9D9_COTGL|nr:neuroglian-like [Cotesia glomerata]KAH0568603.1 hypothetical protein KQX54_021286 [Cotesia glomerata]
MKRSIFILLVLIAIDASSSEVLLPPRLVKQPPKDELLFQVARPDEDHKPFVIECEAEGYPAPAYKWTKNGKLFKSSPSGSGNLEISTPQDDDEGQYQCYAVNEAGIATSNSVFVRKAELNEFQETEIKTVTVNEGDSFYLTCTAPEGWPKPIIYWILQDYRGNIKNINNSRVTIDPEGTLWFSNVTQEDLSKDFYYRCMTMLPFNSEFKLGTKILLNVVPTESSDSQKKREPVIQYVTNQNKVAYRGKTAELFCIFSGTPLPEVTWSKDGEAIKTSDRVSYRNYGKSLRMKNIDFNDEGVYTCEASNGVGRIASYSINLKIMSEPFFTVEPEIVNAEEGEDVKIHCEAHGEPKPDIKWTYNSNPILEAPYNPRLEITKNSILIRDVNIYDIANYGCNATNTIGYIYKDVYINVSAAKDETSQPPIEYTSVETGKN